MDLGGAEAGERGGKWERWVEAKATGRPYPLPASAPARWSGGDVPLLRPRSGEQGGRRPGEGLGRRLASWARWACELGRLVQ